MAIVIEREIIFFLPLGLGLLADRIWADPEAAYHPVRSIGAAIVTADLLLNRPPLRMLKGLLFTLFLCAAVGSIAAIVQKLSHYQIFLEVALGTLVVYWGLAGEGLIRESLQVVYYLRSKKLMDARTYLSRIVGRDTSLLDIQEIRRAVLETLSENLSDGVIAPLFYYSLGGWPLLWVYKTINTLDSMIGYRTPRYEQFGKAAARLDDIANLVPARLTALLMAVTSSSRISMLRSLTFLFKYGLLHESPNAGYPEAALAGLLNGRLGGPSFYQRERIEKPYLGNNERPFTDQDIEKAIRVNQKTTLAMLFLICFYRIGYELWKV